ncbi:MAG: class I SAM-dependent methyltransferase [Gammaproteobacteria bacterium]|nr:MAG: class I SAM-dependent methyltransferase [Gammaproteobacteria bacterium]
MIMAVCPVCRAGETRPFMEVEGRFYWQCGHCQAVWLDPSQRLDADAEAAHYRLHENRVDDPAYRQFLSRLANPLLERLGDGLQGLDFGCGPGPALAAMISEAGYGMQLYDPLFADHPEALQRSYDFITCTEVLEHCHDPAAVLALFDSLLKPGGWLGIMTGMLSAEIDFAQWHYRRDPTHVVFYRQATFACIADGYRWHGEFPSRDVVLLKKPA